MDETSSTLDHKLDIHHFKTQKREEEDLINEMGLACALNLASSAMVNGICCMYQMQEEEIRQKANHEAIRRSIRIEYERNRQLDEEQRQRELREVETAARKTKFTEERRRKLMTKKILSSLERRCISPCKQHRPSVDESLSSTIHSGSGGGRRRRFDLVEPSADTDGSVLLEKVRASVRVNNFIRQASRLSQQSSMYSDSPDMKTSSLLDSDDEFDDQDVQDEEHEEEEEFEEIPIE